MPRTTEVITISLPPEMAEQVRQLMEEEDRTMSGLVREALRLYMRRRSGDASNGTDNGPPAGRASPPKTWSVRWDENRIERQEAEGVGTDD